MLFYLLKHFQQNYCTMSVNLGGSAIRSLFAFLTGFIITLLITPRMIYLLDKMLPIKFPNKNSFAEHVKTVPTGGGLIVLISVLMSSFLWCGIDKCVLGAYLIILWFGGIGLLGDWLRASDAIKNKDDKGLRPYENLFFSAGAAILVANFLYVDFNATPDSKMFWLTFYGTGFPVSKWLYVFIAVVLTSATVNSINLTDGMDGLATGCFSTISLVLAIICYIVSQKMSVAGVLWAEIYNKPYIPQAAELGIFYSSMIGSCLGFLWYSHPPAQVQLGKTGATAFGAAFIYGALVTRQELLLLIAGGVYMMELLSVVLQVFYFKYTGGKRLFRCAPMHHHLHLAGWPESSVVIRFWILSIAFAILALASFFLQ